MGSNIKSLLQATVRERRLPGVGAFVVDATGKFILNDTAGKLNLDDEQSGDLTSDTPAPIYSCTKLVTSIAIIQLVEQGKISLSDSAEKYFPQISEVQVLESITPASDGKPAEQKWSKPKSPPTILQLLNHTAGFTYDFFDTPTGQWRAETGRTPCGYHAVGDMEDFKTPLLAHPGTKYIYGVNIDYLGFIIQEVTGTRLPEHIEQSILKPLGMNATGAFLPKNTPRLITHLRVNGTDLVANPAAVNNESPAVFGGGGYLYSTMNDFAKLLATILNNGTSPETGATILKSESVQKYLFTDHLDSSVDKSGLGEIGTYVPVLSNEGRFFPSLSIDQKGWSCALLLNHEDLPNGRKKGSGAWAGLGNLYYWIDPSSGIAGMIWTSVLPFMDPDVLYLFDQVERVAYGHEIDTEREGLVGNHLGAPKL